MHEYTRWHALIGGIMIGFASLIATVLSGRIPGISGVFGRLLVPATPDHQGMEILVPAWLDWWGCAEFFALG